MILLLEIIHVVVCVLLILIVLLQSGKSADLAGAFGGGGSQTAFGARGTATFLSKLTTGAAVPLLCHSLFLKIKGGQLCRMLKLFLQKRALLLTVQKTKLICRGTRKLQLRRGHQTPLKTSNSTPFK